MFAFTRAARARKRAARLAAIIDHLANHPDSGGYDICKGAGLSSGSLYPELARLEQDGRVTSRWADGPEPRRRLYRLAEEGNR